MPEKERLCKKWGYFYSYFEDFLLVCIVWGCYYQVIDQHLFYVCGNKKWELLKSII